MGKCTPSFSVANQCVNRWLALLFHIMLYLQGKRMRRGAARSPACPMQRSVHVPHKAGLGKTSIAVHWWTAKQFEVTV